MDSYRTISAAGEAVFTEKRSKLLAFAAHTETAEEALAFVAALRRKYYDARHVCWAYALGTDGEPNRCNDDGEPSGSAGRPILGQIRAAETTQVVVAVVRYFGGVKLGTGGLAVAYKTAAAEALAAATIETRTVEAEVSVFAPFTEVDVCLRTARNLDAVVKAQDYTADGTRITFRIRQSGEQRLREALSQIYTVRVEPAE